MATYYSWLLLILLHCPLPPNSILGGCGTSLSQILPYPLLSLDVSGLPISVTPLLNLAGWYTMQAVPSPHFLTHISNPPSVLPFTISVQPPGDNNRELFNHLTFPSASSSVTSCLPKHRSISTPFWPLHPSHLSSSHCFLALSSPCRKIYSSSTLECTFTLSRFSQYTQLYPANHSPELFSSNCVLDALLPYI